jgi:hypothetical protein
MTYRTSKSQHPYTIQSNRTHLTRIQLLDAQHSPSRYLEVCTRRYNDWALAAKLPLEERPDGCIQRELTSKVDGERVLAAAPAMILPTFPDPVYRTTHQYR